MTSIYDLYDTDSNIEQDGITVAYPDVKLQLARAGGSNAQYAKVVKRVTRPFRLQIEKGQLDPKQALTLTARVYAEAIVRKAWFKVGEDEWVEGQIPGRKGPMDATPENLVKLFTDIPDFFADVQAMASQATNYSPEEVEADLKNSEAS